MALDNEIDIESLKEQLKDLGMTYEEELKARMGNVKALKDYADKVKRARDGFKKSSDEILDSMKNLRKGLNAGEMTASELAKELETLRDQINRTSDQDKKASLIAQKADLERLNAQNKANEVMKDSALKFAGGMVAGVGKAFASASRAALAGGDSFEMAGAMMNAGVDLVNTANQGGANALKSFGAATAGAGGKVGRFGVVASVAGEALSAVSNGLSDLAKAGISFMITQTKSLINSFNVLSQSGAIYAGGMNEQIKYSARAGLTMEQFAKATAENRDVFSRAGLGVGEGSKRMAKAMEAGGKSARDGMFALGMSMEEQASAYASTMALLAGPSGNLKSSNQEVAVQTAEYAKNLKVLSNITGEDVKSKQEKIRQENDTLFMMQKINEMEPKQRARFNDMLMTMNDEQRRALTEQMKYGGVISKDLAIAQALSPGIEEANKRFLRAYQDGSASAEVGRKIQQDSRNQIAKDAMDQTALSIAMSDSAVGASKVLASNMKTTAEFSDTAVQSAEEAARRRQQAGAAGQGGIEVSLQAQQQEAALKMQALAVENLGLFSTALKQAYEAAMASVEALAKFAKGIPGESLWQKLAMAALPGIIAGVLPAILTKVFGGAGGSRGSTPLNPMFVEDVTGSGGGGGGGGDRGRKGKKGRYRDKKGRFAKAPKTRIPGVGLASAVVGTAFLASDLSDIGAQEKAGELTPQEAKEAKGGAIGSAALGAAGGWAGAEAGAALGTMFFPGIGTIVGGLLGGAIGYFAGSTLGDDIGKNIAKDPKTKEEIRKKNLDELYRRANPSKPPVKPATSKTSETYMVNGQLVDKATYDQFMKENPQLAAMSSQQGTLKPRGATDPSQLAKNTSTLASQLTAQQQSDLKKAMQPPSTSTSESDRQQITLLQSILNTLQQSNKLSSGILQNSY